MFLKAEWPEVIFPKFNFPRFKKVAKNCKVSRKKCKNGGKFEAYEREQKVFNIQIKIYFLT